MALDEDSQVHLEAAKTGQLRRFAMVCKGEKIISLVVYKDGSVEKYKKQAREKGTGDFCFGEIGGKGTNLVFKVARADGFKEAPAKDQKLKDFLKDEAGMTATPSFEVVERHGQENDANKKPETSGKPDTSKPGTGKPDTGKPDTGNKNDDKQDTSNKKDASSKADPAAKKKMQESLSKVGTFVKTAVQNAPDRKNEILKTYAELQKEVEGDDFEKSRKKLMDYVALVQQLAAAKPEGGGPEDKKAARDWTTVKRTWDKNKSEQLDAVKETMNLLGNLALDKELDADKVNALLEELSTYVPTFERHISALDKALDAAGNSPDSAAKAKVNAAIAALRGFYTGNRIQKLLADFDGKDFFNPTEESLDEIGKLTG